MPSSDGKRLMIGVFSENERVNPSVNWFSKLGEIV